MNITKGFSPLSSYRLRIVALTIYLWIGLKTEAQNTILWQVTSTEVEDTSYLLGTFHQMGNAFVDSIPEIKEKLFASEVAFFESVDPTDSLRAMLNRRTPSVKWRTALRKSDVRFLDKHATDWSVQIGQLTPIELVIKLSQSYMLYTCGTASAEDDWNHFDKYLIHLAKQKGIKVQGLETDSIQTIDINALASNYVWSLARDDVKDIVKSIKKSKTNNPRCEFAKQYMNFDLDYEFSSECIDSNIIIRNKAWMPIVLHHLKTEKVFVAVGLYHLYGQCGLIQQVRQEGYNVEPVFIEKKQTQEIQN